MVVDNGERRTIVERTSKEELLKVHITNSLKDGCMPSI